jgi:peptidoglycan/xylan/chitin deacetylase (PgdA/CDA1 family)
MHYWVGGPNPWSGTHTALQHYSVAEIRADLRVNLGFPSVDAANGFAYPFGEYSDNAITALQAEGIHFAFAFPGRDGWDYTYRHTDPFRIPRFSVTDDVWWHDIGNFSDVVKGGRGGLPLRPGHVLGLETITVADASLAFRGVLGMVTLTDAQKWAAALEGGDPTIADVLRIFRFALGLTDKI